MDNIQFFLYLLVLSGSTYLIRTIPFVAFKKKIHNRFVLSFLKYIPYAVLAAMTVPGAFYATQNMTSAIVGICVAVLVSLKNSNLTLVAITACVSVFITELIMM